MPLTPLAARLTDCGTGCGFLNEAKEGWRSAAP